MPKIDLGLQEFTCALAADFAASKRRPEHLDSAAEAQHIADLLFGALRDPLKEYDDYEVEGVGGSGIVLRVTYKPFASFRALKLPRRRLFEDTRDAQDAPRVDPETHALSKLSHTNITRLYGALAVKEQHCIITEYVENPRSLDEYACATCCDESARASPVVRAQRLRNLAEVVYGLVDAFAYMHDTASLLHFDIKPLNLLVSEAGRAFVTDLGFARDITRYGSNERLEVGFTWKYAHPRLIDPHFGARVSQTAPKSKNTLLGGELRPALDLFAFGRTLQELLFRIRQVYGEAITSDYTFAYLHVVACLCLDGRNSPGESDDQQRSFVSDRALGLPTGVLAAGSLRTFRRVRHALDRLLGHIRLETLVPELDEWSHATINVSDLGITTLTSRVAAVIEHPLVSRLAQERQLGMLDTVFPTATHTRLQHTLGTYHAAGQYLKALYYDPENPVFRILFSPRRAEVFLVATLLHDLGHTNFGHDLEEVDREEFSHTAIGKEVALSGHVDQRGSTLPEILSQPAPVGWQCRFEDVQDLLDGRGEHVLDGVFKDILDGQLDADKLDYLVRDSVECRVAYGHGLDWQRFLRSLTTVADVRGRGLNLAVKRKGGASAEAFGFARYQLYQALYWHHTFRSIKGMFLTAAAETIATLRNEVTRDMWHQHELRNAYVGFVFGLAVTTPLPRRAPPAKGKGNDLASKLRERLVQGEVPPGGLPYGRDKTLLLLWRLGSGKARGLIQDLMGRRYYKRVFEVSLSELQETQWLALKERFEGERRTRLHADINEALVAALIKAIQDQVSSRESLVRDDCLARLAALDSERVAFVVDLPLRGWTASGEAPTFVSDYKRRHFRTDVEARRVGGSSLWSEMGSMMRRIAFFRVFAEPEVHDIITRVMKPADVGEAVAAVVPELRRFEQ